MRLRPNGFDRMVLGVLVLWLLFCAACLFGAGWLVYAIIDFLARH